MKRLKYRVLRPYPVFSEDVKYKYVKGVPYDLNRHGQLFQNRYKSILCQEETYLIELVRYIHLNPLRAGMVKTVEELGDYPYSGHGVLMGNAEATWQDSGSVLSCFGEKVWSAQKNYRGYVEQGVAQGRRADLVGGGLVRSSGGWKGVNAFKTAGVRVKGDERILGDGQFVEQVLREAEESFERRLRLKNEGYDLEGLAHKVEELIGVDPLRARGRYQRVVQARRVFCYWATRDLGMSGTALAKELAITQSAVSMAAREGERVAREQGWRLE